MLRVTAMGLSCGLAGCFFTNDVNTRPVAQIELGDPTAPIYAGVGVTVDGRKSDDADDDTLRYAWQVVACATPMSCAPPFASAEGTSEFTFTPLDKQLLIVSLTVTDSHGARDATTLMLVPENRPPTVVVQILEPPGGYTVGRKLTVDVAAADADGDPISYDWLIDPPTGSQPGQIDLQIIDDTRRTFRPDVPGLWSVRVTVDDGAGPVADEETFLAVADQPPCIAATDPPVITGAHYILPRGDGARWFGVETVTDDLDPYPVPAGTNDPDLGGAHFRWLISGPGGAPFVEVSGHDLHDLLVDPTAYAPGDLLGLRVEITDRVARATCAVDQPTCSVGGDACLQRVTWTAEVR